MTRDFKNIFCFVLGFLIAFIVMFSFEGAHAATTSTSGVTAQTVMDRARIDLNESTAVMWPDSNLLQWMDEAVREIVYQTRSLESAASNVIMNQDVYTYPISGSFLDIETALHDSGDTTEATKVFALKRIDIKDFGHSKETGKPKFFTIWANSLLIWPIPDSDQSGSTVILYRVTLPSGITTTSSQIETPSYFDPAILNFLKARAFYKDVKEALGNYYMGLFDKRIREYMINVQRREVLDPELPQ